LLLPLLGADGIAHSGHGGNGREHEESDHHVNRLGRELLLKAVNCGRDVKSIN
jgi:hypothetical protein